MTAKQYFQGDNMLIRTPYGVMSINGAVNLGLFAQWNGGDPIRNDGTKMSAAFASGLSNIDPKKLVLVPYDQYDSILLSTDAGILNFAVSDRRKFVQDYFNQTLPDQSSKALEEKMEVLYKQNEEILRLLRELCG
jgi:hypothetical protein